MEAGTGVTTTRAIASTSEGRERARRFATEVAATARRAFLRYTGHVHDAPTAYQNADRPVLTSLFESIRRFVRLRRRALVWDLRARPRDTDARAPPPRRAFPPSFRGVPRLANARERRLVAAEPRRGLAAEFPSPHPVGSAMDAEHHDDRGAGHPPPLPPNPYPYDDHGAGGVGSKRGRSPSRYPPGDPGYDDDRRRRGGGGEVAAEVAAEARAPRDRRCSTPWRAAGRRRDAGAPRRWTAGRDARPASIAAALGAARARRMRGS